MTSISDERIAAIEARRDEIANDMAAPDLAPERFVALSREYAELEPVAAAAHEVRRLRASGLDVDGSGIAAARVHGDPRLLGQLLRNLADNAARHSRGRLAIGVTPTDRHVFVTVEDDGAGVPPEERERIFERFVRLDEARSRDAGGSGLGLAIVRAIATAAGGSVTVDDSRWGGARFVVTLPLAHPGR